MALVDFKCDKCGAIVERENGDATLCCGELMRRIWSAVGIAFKGSGFYVNDYKKGARK